MQQLNEVEYILAGLLIVAIFALGWQYFRHKIALNQQQQDWRTEQALLQQQVSQFGELNQDQQIQLQQAQLKLESQQSQLHKFTARLRESQLELSYEKQRSEEKAQLHSENERKLQQQFEHLSQRIFAEETAKFKTLNKESLELLLNPLQQQIAGFKNQVNESYHSEAKERHSLKVEVEKLAQLNQQIVTEAANLSQALKGDNKQQGSWGEVILQQILDNSGLREGYEYHAQQSLTNGAGKRYQPDIVVHLPQNKDIIIDSKVSLTAYERYFNSDDKNLQNQALAEHVASVKGHIKGLGQKDYHKLNGVRTLDYVLLFIAVEPAFLLAIQEDPSLVKLALDNNILLASPSNLMIALRTIENLWRYQKQEDNSRQIAQKAGKLYEKLRLFSEDLLEVGQGLDRTQTSFDRALKRFSQGRGNLVQQAEHFRELGAEVNKPLPEAVLAHNEANKLGPSNALGKRSEQAGQG
ncbi:DNA recombination protein RmuC [Motilimonas pumila]|uniref:DNA recombination protein RmuC n=1 Tax=Motilimonas pumila TaxID=2303987 RepID=A0A418YJ29_9GAMM|nr:DNA recombination protein RmuC [Motilimonas pumila]RJG50656.1 DNA recombination protein RmuC [Motilimonas pumila]